jgi:transcriptional regulator with XRE-family HTH domain
MANGEQGRPAWAPTGEQRFLVRLMMAAGYTQEKIAEHLNVTRPTLRKYCRKELQDGKAQVLSGIAISLYQTAANKKDPDWFRAACFVMKTQGGWRETDRLELEHLNQQDERPVLSISFANGGPGHGQALLTDGVESDGVSEGIIESEAKGLILSPGPERTS